MIEDVDEYIEMEAAQGDGVMPADMMTSADLMTSADMLMETDGAMPD